MCSIDGEVHSTVHSSVTLSISVWLLFLATESRPASRVHWNVLETQVCSHLSSSSKGPQDLLPPDGLLAIVCVWWDSQKDGLKRLGEYIRLKICTGIFSWPQGPAKRVASQKGCQPKVAASQKLLPAKSGCQPKVVA